MPTTSRHVTFHPIALREVAVKHTRDITPGMRRVTFTGAELDGFQSTGFDDDIRFVFPHPGHTVPVLPTIENGALRLPKDPRPLMRIYTVRAWNLVSCELEVDFVRHGIGVATTWAYRAQPGDKVHFFGPGASKSIPDNADWFLIVGDDTALPAIARLCEELPDDAQGHVFIEVAEESHIQSLRHLPGLTISWLPRNGAEPGTTSLLLDAVKGVEWREGTPFAWIAAEQATVRHIRRHLVEERKMSKGAIDFTGYWRRTAVRPLAQDTAVPNIDAAAAAYKRFQELTDLIPPIALRVAAELNLADLISRGITETTELASAAGCDIHALSKLLRYLEVLGVLTHSGDGNYILTEVGDFLASDFRADALSPVGVVGRQNLGIFALTEAIRSGAASYASITGHSYADVRSDHDYEQRFIESYAATKALLVSPLVASDVFKDSRHLALYVDAAGPLVAELLIKYPWLEITICGQPTHIECLRQEIDEIIPDETQRSRVHLLKQPFGTSAPEADTILFVHRLAELPDSNAADALRSTISGMPENSRILLIEDTFNTASPTKEDCEADLLSLTRTGSGLRTEEGLNRLIEDAGLQLTGQVEHLGRGVELRELSAHTFSHHDRHNLHN